MVNADEQQPTPVSLDRSGGQEAGLDRGPGASGRQTAEGGGLVPGECAFCGSGNETEPLGWVVGPASLCIACLTSSSWHSEMRSHACCLACSSPVIHNRIH